MAANRKFTLEVQDTVRRMIGMGKTVDAIAAAVNMTKRSLYTRCCQHGISLRYRKTSLEVTEKLLREAERRGTTHSVLVGTLLRHIANDDLFAAVLEGDLPVQVQMADEAICGN
jgi:hypothetical protein